MASTNKTTNYELSQFLGTDKPAWLSDYNTDMSKIDAGMKDNADGVTAVSGVASANATAIGSLPSLTTDVKTDLVSAVNEVDSHADTAQSVANSANTTASGCRTDLNKFNLTNRSDLTPTINLGTIDSNLSKIQFATDTTNSIFKVYGRLVISSLNGISGTLTVKLGQTSLRPATAYEINSGIIIIVKDTQGAYQAIGSRNIKVDTDGSIYGVVGGQSSILDLIGSTATIDLIVSPCLYFNTDFGDQ